MCGHLRWLALAWLIFAAASPAAGVSVRSTLLVTIPVRVTTPDNKPVNDMRPEEFTLEVDGKVQAPESWVKVVSLLRHRTTYRLVYQGTHAEKTRQHGVVVRVNRPEVRLTYVPSVRY